MTTRSRYAKRREEKRRGEEKRGERQSQGPRYNVSSCARDCMGAAYIYILYVYICTHAADVSLFLSSSFFLVSSLTTDRTENIGTPYVFPETRFIEAITSVVLRENKNKPVNNATSVQLFPLSPCMYI